MSQNDGDCLGSLLRMYDEYVDTYRLSDGALPRLMQLKRAHTGFVVKNAAAIADGEGFDPLERECALAAALLHDTGRYEQLKLYNTFRDADSIDHAVFSHQIVKSKGWLAAAGASRPESVLAAILYHNRRDLPDGLDRVTLAAAQAVRDADKLDIFRVLQAEIATVDWRKDSRAFWNLATDKPPSAEVVACIEARSPVDYQAIKSLSDFVMIQVGWMISGLYYRTSRRLCAERGHLAFRRDFLHRLSDDPAVDRVCDLAESVLSEGVSPK